MSAFNTVTPAAPAPAPDKHVNYTLGMVLGVADFAQEFTYHSERDKWLARDLLGCGTVRGLGVSVDTASGSNSPEVVVQPGVALTPQGQIVRVPTAQCALLQQWIATRQAKGTDFRQYVFGSPATSPGAPESGTLTLYVFLRYSECETDNVPIPGEPCRSEDDAMAASRIKDDFLLDLSLTPPAPTEEPGMQGVIAWLAQVPIVNGAGSSADDLRKAMKASFGPSSPGSPMWSPMGAYTPPPPGLAIGAAAAGSMYRAALQFYATDLRDLIACAPTADAVPTETAIMLATLQIPVAQDLNGQWQIVGAVSGIVVDPTRPFLLPLDMIKEAWLLVAAESVAIAAARGLALRPLPPVHVAPRAGGPAHILESATGPRYRLAAAGVVAVKAAATDPDPSETDPPLTPGLVAVWSKTIPGDVTVTFQDSPAPGTRYIVKVQPMLPAPSPPVIAVGLLLRSVATTPPSFTVHVTANNAEVVTSTGLVAPLSNLRLHIEVNAFVAT
jgi:hypothetical protein